MSALKQAALEYAAKGWPVFPCNASKKPYVENGVLDATTSRKQIEDWWDTWPNANIALDVGGAGMVVLDFDPGHDLREVEKNIGALPETKLSQTTPRGGKHLFFAKKPDEVIPPSVSKVAHKVDVRSFNSYVLLPPSKTKDGSYAWTSQGKPAFRSDKLAEVAKQKRETSEDRDNWLIEPDLPENIAACADWLKNKAQIAVEGVNGDHMAYSTAAMCKSYGISPQLALDLMWEHWNPRCSPPWAPDEIEHLENKIRNGYSYNTSPPGNMTAAYKVARAQELFRPVSRDTDQGGKEIKGGRFRVVNRQGMDDIKPSEWILHDAVPMGGSGLLIGPRGTFKTFVALDMALSIASGGKDYFGGVAEDWLGVWPDVAKPGAVLFAAGEGRSGLKKRVAAWEQHHLDGGRCENFYLIDPVPGPNVDDVTAFIEAALAMNPEGYRLVILDTVGRAMAGLNENSQQDASLYTKMVETILHELSDSVLGLHHSGHGTEGRARGSSVFGADIDFEFVLERKDKEHVIRLKNTKQKDAQEWERPKVVQLIEKSDSLVAVAPSKQLEEKTNAAAEQKKEKKERAKADDAIDLGVIRQAAYEFLKTAPGKEFSGAHLAISIAADPRITLEDRIIRERYVGKLLVDKQHPIATCFDSHKKVWRYSPPFSKKS